MEKINLNFTGSQNIIKSICWILSYLSWLLLTINSFVSLGYLFDKDYLRIWNIIVKKDISEHIYLPIQMFYIITYIVFIFSIVIIFFGCIFFFFKTLIKKDEQIINTLMNQYTQYHFFPLLCAFVMFILGEIKIKEDKDFKTIFTTGLIFSLFGLGTMIFIYIMTESESNDWKINFFIKKGTYSCLIILFWYNFCYSIFHVHSTNENNVEKIHKWMKGCGLAFSIIFGLGNSTFILIFKDILICFLNLLIYIGLVIYYYISEIQDESNHVGKGDDIVDFIFICFSFLLLVFLINFDSINKYNEFVVEIRNLKEEVIKINTKIDDNKEEFENFINVLYPTPKAKEKKKDE